MINAPHMARKKLPNPKKTKVRKWKKMPNFRKIILFRRGSRQAMERSISSRMTPQVISSTMTGLLIRVRAL